MMNLEDNVEAIDIYAATNPAFGALTLAAFCSAFSSDESRSRSTYPLLFVVLPILFSRKGIASFDGTNVNTGFFEWLERHPEITVGLSESIQSGIPYTNAALRFAICHRLLKTTGYEYSLDETHAWKRPKWPKTDERGHLLSCAKRLGSWLARVPDETTIFHALGVRP